MPLFKYLIAPVTTDPRAEAARCRSEPVAAARVEGVAEPMDDHVENCSMVKASCSCCGSGSYIVGLQVPNGSWGAADLLFSDFLSRLNFSKGRRQMELVRRLAC